MKKAVYVGSKMILRAEVAEIKGQVDAKGFVDARFLSEDLADKYNKNWRGYPSRDFFFIDDLGTEKPLSFVDAWNEIADSVHQTAREKGWWDAPKEVEQIKMAVASELSPDKYDSVCSMLEVLGRRNSAEMLALMHSELSEGLEALRHGDPADSHLPEFNSLEVELADVVIRMMDFAAAKGLKVAEAIQVWLLNLLSSAGKCRKIREYR